MKIIVAGGRDFTNKEMMKDFLQCMYQNGNLDDSLELVCGMAKGADMTAYELFEEEGLVVHERPADWQDMSEPCVVGTNYFGKYNKLAGMKRNHAMGDEADILVAFWDGSSKGTKDMIEYMNKLGKPVHIVKY